MGQEWLTVAEISQELKLHAMTVYRLISAGKLEAVKVGRSYRVSRSEFDRYLREARTK
jgi:excisionase family DNA binding protein